MPYFMKLAPYALSVAVAAVGYVRQGFSEGVSVGGAVLVACYLVRATIRRTNNDMEINRYGNGDEKGCIDTARFRIRDFDN